jgi:hypothetical protein
VIWRIATFRLMTVAGGATLTIRVTFTVLM